MTIPDDLVKYVTPKGIWYYLRLREFCDVGQRKKITTRELKVNRTTAAKNNFVLQKFGFIKVETMRGYRKGNIYEILR